jgi:hypothetical protein
MKMEVTVRATVAISWQSGIPLLVFTYCPTSES